MIRNIKKIVNGHTTKDGAGVKLVRVISHSDVRDFDPFLLLDAFDSDNPEDYIKGFPWHPHRGIETVTYLIKGDIEHGDSLGNKGSILDGGCQWMTAGGGILHQEMPQATEEMLGVQLWLNLPAKDKMTNPQYRDIVKADVPVVKTDQFVVSVISGNFEGTEGPVSGDYVHMDFYDVAINPNEKMKIATKPENTVFIYVVHGEGTFGAGEKGFVKGKDAVLFESGDSIEAVANDRGIRFLLFSGKPLKEPIAWGGPIVMNTQDELKKAFSDLDKGTFISHDVIR